MDGFVLSTGAVSDAGWHFARLAAEISTITTWWESNMSVLGDYCGTDTAGQQFKAIYQPKLDSVDQALPGIIQQLYGVGTALDRLAQTTTGNDTVHAQAVRRSTLDHVRGRPN
jgi:hypothetical protein